MMNRSFASTFLNSASEQNASAAGEGDNIALRDMDVVCGRTRLAHNHPGNRRYNSMVHAYRVQYQCASRDDKAPIVHALIENIKAGGGRFVKFDEQDEKWQLLDDLAQYDKVSHALRSAKEYKSRASQVSIQTFVARRRNSDSAVTRMSPEQETDAARLFEERHQQEQSSMKVSGPPAEGSSNISSPKSSNVVLQRSFSSVEERPQQFWFEAVLSPPPSAAVASSTAGTVAAALLGTTESSLYPENVAAAAPLPQRLSMEQLQKEDEEEEAVAAAADVIQPLSMSSPATFGEEDVHFLEDWCSQEEQQE